MSLTEMPLAYRSNKSPLNQIPNCLSIAGLDPSGGAGILADLKTFSALGAYGCAALTALTAQNTHGVADVWPMTPAQLRSMLNTLWDDVRIDAVKIGMIATAGLIETTATCLIERQPKHVVLDPVMIAKSGDALLAPNALQSLREMLLPLAHVITPNLPEAAALLDESLADSLRQMQRVAERLHNQLARQATDERWVYLKGGHLPDHEDAIDLLFNGDRMITLRAPRIATKHTHGTGCTLSAAIAACLSVQITELQSSHTNLLGNDIPTAAQRAKDYVTQAIQHADRLDVGKGQGPLHHFHAWW